MLNPERRDYSAILEAGRCACCQELAPQKKAVPWVIEHAKRHLADGSAIVMITTPEHGGRTQEHVMPTNNVRTPERRKPVSVKRSAAESFAAMAKRMGFRGVFKP